MSRIPLPSPETMTPEQLRVYEDIVGGPREALVGPLRAALHRPELADRWQKLGLLLRYETSLPPRLSELAILVTARRWNSQVEWHVHASEARKAGIADEVIDAIKHGRSPMFVDPDEAVIYEFTRELQNFGTVSDELYQQVLARWNAVGSVELTALVGYYTMVAMTLNAHEIPMPRDVLPPLTPVIPPTGGNGNCAAQLTTLAPGQLASTTVRCRK